MRRPGLRTVVIVGLLAAVVALGVHTVLLRRQLARAEFYAQSGASSVIVLCAPVLRELHRPSGAMPTLLAEMARACMGTIYEDEDMEAIGRAFTKADREALARWIEDRMAARKLPYMTGPAVGDRFLPWGYK